MAARQNPRSAIVGVRGCQPLTLQTVGPKNLGSGTGIPWPPAGAPESPGARTPATNRNPRSPIPPRATPTAPQPSPDPRRPNRCLYCERAFSTKSGLGVHVRSAHPTEANAAINVTRAKARWTDEEMYAFAAREAAVLQDIKDGLRSNCTRILNYTLYYEPPDGTRRTQEAIKKLRQREVYKKLVEGFVADPGTIPPNARTPLQPGPAPSPARQRMVAAEASRRTAPPPGPAPAAPRRRGRPPKQTLLPHPGLLGEASTSRPAGSPCRTDGVVAAPDEPAIAEGLVLMPEGLSVTVVVEEAPSDAGTSPPCIGLEGEDPCFGRVDSPEPHGFDTALQEVLASPPPTTGFDMEDQAAGPSAAAPPPTGLDTALQEVPASPPPPTDFDQEEQLVEPWHSLAAICTPVVAPSAATPCERQYPEPGSVSTPVATPETAPPTDYDNTKCDTSRPSPLGNQWGRIHFPGVFEILNDDFPPLPSVGQPPERPPTARPAQPARRFPNLPEPLTSTYSRPITLPLRTADEIGAAIIQRLRSLEEELGALEVWGSRQLLRVITDLVVGDIEDAYEELRVWVDLVTPSQTQVAAARNKAKRRPPRAQQAEHVRRRTAPPNRAKRRAALYAATQEAWKKTRSRTAKAVLSGEEALRNTVLPGGVQPPFSSRQMFEFWGPLFTAQSCEVAPPEQRDTPAALWALWWPVTVAEVRASRVPNTSAAGPDLISPRMWAACPSVVKLALFNILLYVQAVPVQLAGAYTVFIPKVDEPGDPSQYRPITVSSVMLRHFHKVLAARLRRAGVISEFQRAFEDGCLENTSALAATLHHARSNLKQLHVASLDIAKAFDTVSHQALSAVLKEMGVPPPFVHYLDNVYASSTTTLRFGRHQSDFLSVGRGVRQGDPLSSFLFCLVIDRVLRSLPAAVYYPLPGAKLQHLAYADDVLLFGSTVPGLQMAISAFSNSAERVGLALNPKKSLSLSLIPSRDKKSKIVTDSLFRLPGGQHLQPASTTTVFKYLGVFFSPTGAGRSGVDLKELLGRVTRAPLKPQQRLYIVRHHLIPSLHHQLILGRVTAKMLREMDISVRNAVRTWLRLPHDTPLGFFHADCSHGGLGVPSLAAAVPALVYFRVRKLAVSRVPVFRAVSETVLMQRRLGWALSAARRFDPQFPDTTARPGDKFFVDKLHTSTDGFELREAGGAPASTAWLTNATSCYPGSDFVGYVHVLINALPSRVRTTRGKPTADVRCRAGCRQAETTAHCVQLCHRSHGGRILRHDAVVKTVAAHLQRKQYRVLREPHIMTGDGLRKPDIAAGRDGELAFVMDAQVVSGAPPLARSYNLKRAKYAGADIRRRIQEEFNLPSHREIPVYPLTLTWRGIWEQRSARTLLDLGFPKSMLTALSTRVLMGSLLNFRRWFGKSTRQLARGSRPIPRAGIG